ncbi:MAG: hypothetical protein K8L97_09700 [Anaerolineae bacterium]|nr:hypothetical protein [Anaerolineae bacterium]
MDEMFSKLAQLEASFGAMHPQFAKAGLEIAQEIRRYYGGLADPARPIGIFLLLGTTAQNPLPDAVAQYLYNEAPFRIDMGLYADSASSFSDHLTEITRLPNAKVLVLGDIEKANPSVRALLTDVFHSGCLPEKGMTFTDRVIFMICNLQPSQVSDEAVQRELVRELVYRTFERSFLAPINLLFQFDTPSVAED